MKKVIISVGSVLIVLLTLWGFACEATATPTPTGPYRVDAVEEGTPTHHWQHRCYYNDHHFLTVSHFDKTGVVVIRPRPGCDPNGWGSSLYPMPHTQDADGVLINANTIVTVNPLYYVNVFVTGTISDGTPSGFGSYSWDLTFNYHPEDKRIWGSGLYEVNAVYPLPSNLSLYLLASNFLCNVPLQSGDTGDTGDTGSVYYQVGGLAEEWYPPDDDHYPQENGNWVLVDAPGMYNEVDNLVQGFYTPTPGVTPSPITAAYKPSLKVILQSAQPDIKLYFGASYAMEPVDACNYVEYPSCKCKQFWEDNIGLITLIHHDDPGGYSDYYFTVTFESQALPEDPTCTPTPNPPLPITSPAGIVLLLLLLSTVLFYTSRSTR